MVSLAWKLKEILDLTNSFQKADEETNSSSSGAILSPLGFKSGASHPAFFRRVNFVYKEF